MNEIKAFLKEYYEIYFSINSAYERLAKHHGLTSSALFVLYIMLDYPQGCTQKLICEKLFYPKQTVNAILKGFEKDGYISKETSGQDRRGKNITLTISGQAYAEKVLTAVVEFEQAVLLNMSDQERMYFMEGERVFLKQITKMIDHIDV